MNRFTVLVLGLLLALVAAACGNVPSESMAMSVEDAEATTIRISTSRIEGFETALAAWEREHPTISVEVVADSPRDHHDWILEGTRPPAPVDIVAIDSEYGAAARAHPELFVDLSVFRAGGAGLTDRESDFLASRWNEGIGIGGELISLPLDVDAQLLFVRSDLASAEIIDQLVTANSWCDVLDGAGAFVQTSGKAFLADGEEMLRAILSQSRAPLEADGDQLSEATRAELERAWNLSMITAGAPTIGANPCPNLGDLGPLARDLTPGESVWQAEIASDDFGAVISPWSTRSRIGQAHPDSAGKWVGIALPADSQTPGGGSSSIGGLQLAIAAGSDEVDVALDLILTLTDPLVQRRSFAKGEGPLPAAQDAHDDGTVHAGTDPFFLAMPSIGAQYAPVVEGRSTRLATVERIIATEILIDALARVQAGVETPQAAWDAATIEILHHIELNS